MKNHQAEFDQDTDTGTQRDNFRSLQITSLLPVTLPGQRVLFTGTQYISFHKNGHLLVLRVLAPCFPTDKGTIILSFTGEKKEAACHSDTAMPVNTSVINET